jgi:hypothetical protein
MILETYHYNKKMKELIGYAAGVVGGVMMAP